MTAAILARADGLIGRLMAGFVDTSSGHPVLTVGFFGLLLALVVLLWIEMLDLRVPPLAHLGRRIRGRIAGGARAP